jgi:hypothetical protein
VSGERDHHSHAAVHSAEGEMAYLKVGDWQIHTNSITGTLRIHEIDELGRVFGALCDEPIRGWWSERGRRLTFVRERGRADASDEQGFEGYAWDEPTDVGARRSYYLSGSYETYGGGGGAKDRQSFGWFATFATGPAPQ